MGMPGGGGFGSPLGMIPNFGHIPGYQPHYTPGMNQGGHSYPPLHFPDRDDIGGHRDREHFGNDPAHDAGNRPPAANEDFDAHGRSGSDAVDIARRYEGNESWRLRGVMPHFTAAGGRSNNCADFVSSALEGAGMLRGHHVGVSNGDLQNALIRQGYHRVSGRDAMPGDVAIKNGGHHTELVATRGATRTIGSNNDRPGHQVISERRNNPNSGVYYHKDTKSSRMA